MRMKKIKIRNIKIITQKMLSYKTTINSTKKLRIIKFLVLFFLHGPENHEINKQNMSTEPP